MTNSPDTPKAVKTIQEAKERLRNIDKGKLRSNTEKAKRTRGK